MAVHISFLGWLRGRLLFLFLFLSSPFLDLFHIEAAGKTSCDEPNIFEEIQAVTNADKRLFKKKLKGKSIKLNKKSVIQFFPWVHSDPFLGDVHTLRDVIAKEGSQLVDLTLRENFELLKELEKTRPDAVFLEGRDSLHDLSRDDYSILIEMVTNQNMPDYLRASYLRSYGAKLRDNLRALQYFSDGVPSRLEELNDEQKYWLYTLGGGQIAFALGFAKEIRGTERAGSPFSKKVSEYLQGGDVSKDVRKWRTDILKIVFEERETEALVRVAEWIRLNPDQTNIFLVFGRGHHLEDYSVNGKMIIQRFKK